MRVPLALTGVPTTPAAGAEPPPSWAGRTVLAVGAAAEAGLGPALAAALVEQGATLCWCGLPGQPVPAQATLDRRDRRTSDEGAVDDALDEALARLPAPDLVVLVGETPAAGPAPAPAELSPAAWRATLDELVSLPFLALRRIVMAYVLARCPGCIVLVLRLAETPSVAERAALEALRALVRSVAREYGVRGIRINAIALSWPAGVPEALDAVAFLASDEAAFVDGELWHLSSPKEHRHHG